MIERASEIRKVGGLPHCRSAQIYFRRPYTLLSLHFCFASSSSSFFFFPSLLDTD